MDMVENIFFNYFIMYCEMLMVLWIKFEMV